MNYTDENRGTIQFRDRRRQLIDCHNLRIGNITPTDCDGLIEYKNKAYIIFELKRRGVEVPKGQLLAFERAVDDWLQANKLAVLIIADHDIENPEEDIDAAACLVRTFYYRGRWYTPNKPVTLKDAIDIFINYADGRGTT